MGFFDRIKNAWALMGSSWTILKKDKEIIVFPLLSAFFTLLVMASFALPILQDEDLMALFSDEGNAALREGEIPTSAQIKIYTILFLFYFFSYFIITFFNSAIVACAVYRMSGRDPTVSFGLAAAFERIHLIAGWALLSATVGFIIKVIENRSKNIGKLIAGFAGLAWTVASALAIPVLVIEKKGPFAALKDSAAMIRKTWGEGLAAMFSFGLLFGLLALPGFLLIVAGIMTGSLAAGITFAVPGLLYLILLKLIESSLEVIFLTALYGYAKKGYVVRGFDETALSGAFRPDQR
jgi:hypothetical protein